ncbi:hypothetical protein GOM96_03390 [Stutzerimonas degradans]|nr:hypothetical protein GOM96_03390 [Stutzerimonas degradans]
MPRSSRWPSIPRDTWSPDYRAMWINAQHPGLSFPASDGQSGPCSSTVLITRDDSGVIGT